MTVPYTNTLTSLWRSHTAVLAIFLYNLISISVIVDLFVSGLFGRVPRIIRRSFRAHINDHLNGRHVLPYHIVVLFCHPCGLRLRKAKLDETFWGFFFSLGLVRQHVFFSFYLQKGRSGLHRPELEDIYNEESTA